VVLAEGFYLRVETINVPVHLNSQLTVSEDQSDILWLAKITGRLDNHLNNSVKGVFKQEGYMPTTFRAPWHTTTAKIGCASFSEAPTVYSYEHVL
jgi:hypothetical protein